nr:immunoglobulin heavy chain junction region [Macaca mulatta]MOW75169.1 immunoglobulin heavy chain junction region [Macaca mulatta]MOW75591.1 immunoglobulin heavy chain junction region [Macaca mulatta]MOW75611.1 immunoglobulin heavy chain junction region [Macaca mulatta]MOW75637.1 immunoglobulin heavy chain junction region [Macaca mulatta]
CANLGRQLSFDFW